jgi:hypothetical protein
MNDNTKIINSYLSRAPTYVITKKKNQIYVKDGIITYKIDCTNYECQCSRHLCNHLLFLLEQKFKCDVKIFKFFHKIRSQLCQINTYNELIREIKKSVGDECGICTTNMLLNNDLFECGFCKKYCHQSCLNRWINTIKNDAKHDKTCIYCHSYSYI